MDVAFVSTNEGKFREVASLLAPFGVRVRWSPRTLPELQADRLATVARAKLAAVPASSRRVLVEDSGLFLEAFPGFPGVYSAPVYALLGFGPILRLLRGRTRAAAFRTVAALRWDGTVRLFYGEVRGRIALGPRGAHGFGYDPIFLPEGAARTFAEMGPAEKDAISHRGQAIRRAGAWMRRRAGPRARAVARRSDREQM